MNYAQAITKIWNALETIYENMINFLFTTTAGVTDLPNIFQVIGVAFLTILIPIAIAIFSDKSEFETLDKNVILDHIIKAKSLLLYLALIFLPFLFWNGSCLWLRFLEIVIWAFGVYFMIKILVNSYHWMKGNKFTFRFDYLRQLRDVRDLEESWRFVWQSEKINPQNEREFFELFSSLIDQLLRNNE